MEGHIYNCTWKKVRGKYLLRLNDFPEIHSEAADFVEASDTLCEAICVRTGDGEAVLEFDPPPPKDATLREWTRPEIRVLGYSEHVRTNIAQPEMYTAAPCEKCGFTRGERTSLPIVIKQSVKSDVFRAAESRPDVLLCSEKVAGALQRSLRDGGINLKPALTEKRAKNVFFEITGNPIVPFVSFRNAVYNSLTNWRCTVCGRRSLHPFHRRFWGSEIQHFVAAADLPADLPSAFAIGSNNDQVVICLTSVGLSEFHRLAIKGVVTHPLGIVSKKYLDRSPESFEDYPTPRQQQQ